MANLLSRALAIARSLADLHVVYNPWLWLFSVFFLEKKEIFSTQALRYWSKSMSSFSVHPFKDFLIISSHSTSK